MSEATNRASAQDSLTFPPYGNVCIDVRLKADGIGAPSRFTVAGRPGTTAEWDRYLQREAQQMAEFLWPMFDPSTSRWIGKSVATMEALTRADLKLMQSLAEVLKEEAKAGGKGLERNHLDLFQAEDSSARPTMAAYLPALTDAQRTTLDGTILQWLDGIGDAHIRFKAIFQRPRAYQMAFILMPEQTYTYRHATSAVTPALISGHAFQGLVARCGGYISHRLSLEASFGAVDRLQQYAIDIGDRRVFAGVHYPSDNLASWYCGLRLCDHFFARSGAVAKRFMWASIQRSRVYAAMCEASQGAQDSPYTEPLARLQSEAEREPDVTADVPLD